MTGTEIPLSNKSKVQDTPQSTASLGTLPIGSELYHLGVHTRAKNKVKGLPFNILMQTSEVDVPPELRTD